MKNFLIAILLITVLVLGYLAFKPKEEGTTSNTVSSSKTVTESINNKAPAKTQPTTQNYNDNGISVDYPTKYTWMDTATFSAAWGVNAIYFYDGDPEDNSRETQIKYVIYVKDNISDNVAMDSFTKRFIKHINGDMSFPITEKTVSVDGRTGIQYSYKAVAGGYNGTVYTTAVVHNKKAYIIHFVNGKPADYMAFLSSVKFK